MFKMTHKTSGMFALTVAALLGWTGSALAAPILLLDLKAADFNTVTGIWEDSSGNNTDAKPLGTFLTVTANATPNGSSAVSFVGTGFLNIQPTEIPPTTGLTYFAYVQPTGATNRGIVTGGGSAPMWRLNTTGKQELNSLGSSGTSTTAVPTTSFSNINVAFDSTGTGTYRYNGAVDGTHTGTGFGSNPNVFFIGGAAYNQNMFKGLIAEVRIYKGVLTTEERQAVEDEFTASYVTIPEPATFGLLAIGGLMMIHRGKR